MDMYSRAADIIPEGITGNIGLINGCPDSIYQVFNPEIQVGLFFPKPIREKIIKPAIVIGIPQFYFIAPVKIRPEKGMIAEVWMKQVKIFDYGFADYFGISGLQILLHFHRQNREVCFTKQFNFIQGSQFKFWLDKFGRRKLIQG